MIIQNEPVVAGAGADMSFTVPRADLRDALDALERARRRARHRHHDRRVRRQGLGHRRGDEDAVRRRGAGLLDARRRADQHPDDRDVADQDLLRHRARQRAARRPRAARGLPHVAWPSPAGPSRGSGGAISRSASTRSRPTARAGRHQTLLVAPPGSGKTVVGLEIVRRLGAPALVLCPSRTIQRQWGEKQALFGPDQRRPARADLPVAVPDLRPGGDAARRRRAGVGRASGRASPASRSTEVVAEAAGWEGQAAARRERDVARLVAAMKRRVAAGKLPDLPRRPAALVERAGARRRAARRRRARRRARRVPPPAVAVGRAAEGRPRPARARARPRPHGDEPEGRHRRAGRAVRASCSTARTSPCRRRRSCARASSRPTRSSSSSARRLPSEQEWLAERHARFELALDELAPCGREEHLGLDAWLSSRLCERLSAGGGALSWSELARRQPRLAGRRAALAARARHGRRRPDAPHGEQHRAALTVDDWVVLLEDYALRCLRADASARGGAAARRAAGRARRPRLRDDAAGYPPCRWRGRPRAAELGGQAAGDVRRARLRVRRPRARPARGRHVRLRAPAAPAGGLAAAC